jgi:hypothetical protein
MNYGQRRTLRLTVMGILICVAVVMFVLWILPGMHHP